MVGVRSIILLGIGAVPGALLLGVEHAVTRRPTTLMIAIDFIEFPNRRSHLDMRQNEY
jgi:uncharacterized protein involved in cysteine biosynthesis